MSDNNNGHNNGAAHVSDETPFERFERLTKQLLAVSKAELDKQRGKAKKPTRAA